MMLTLLKKDVMLNRVPIAGNAISIVAIYAILVIVMLSSPRPIRAIDALDYIGAAAFLGICLTGAIIAVYAGVAFAQERRERSANFLAMMPLRRRPILISKLIVCWTLPAGFVLLNGIVLAIVFVLQGQTDRLPNAPPVVWRVLWEMFLVVLTGVAMAWMLFGVAWLASAISESPSIAACIAWGALAMVNLTIILIIQRLDYSDRERNELTQFLCSTVSFAIGMGCFILGTCHYLTRTEP